MKRYASKNVYFWILYLVIFSIRTVECNPQNDVDRSDSPLVGSSQDDNSSKLRTVLEQRVRQLMKCGDIPGLSIAVVKENRTMLIKGFGFGDNKRQQHINKNSVFCIASLSKAFTSTLIASLLGDHENITWDTPLRSILGHGFGFADVIRTESASIRDLLAHRMGIPRYDLARLSSSFRKDFYRRLKFLSPSMPFRRKFMYNNWMYYLAARVSEKLGGKTWENLLQQRIFFPLKMSSTTFTSELEDKSEGFVHALIKKSGKFAEVDPYLHRIFSLKGADSICSTAGDMAKWLKFHIHAVTTSDHHPLSNSSLQQETYKDVLKKRERTRDDRRANFSTNGYGLGWSIGKYKGEKTLTHSGDLLGYTSKLTIIPKYRLGIFTGSNGPAGSGNNELAHEILHSLLGASVLGHDKQFSEQEACNALQSQQKQSFGRLHQQKTRHDTHLSLKQFSPFIGHYVHSGLGIINISYFHDKKSLQMTYGAVIADLHPGEIVDRFLIKPMGFLKSIYSIEPDYKRLSFIDFIRKSNGGVLAATMPLFDWENPPMFVKYVEGETPSETLDAEYQIYVKEFQMLRNSFSQSTANFIWTLSALVLLIIVEMLQ